ncbi:adhesion G protein-coupled receptor L4-like, partial [Vespula squamosa]
MESLYTGAIHGFHQPNGGMVANGFSTGIASSFDQDGVLSLIVVLGGSLSLVALVFAFITYSKNHEKRWRVMALKTSWEKDAVVFFRDEEFSTKRGEEKDFCR